MDGSSCVPFIINVGSVSSVAIRAYSNLEFCLLCSPRFSRSPGSTYEGKSNKINMFGDCSLFCCVPPKTERVTPAVAVSSANTDEKRSESEAVPETPMQKAPIEIPAWVKGMQNSNLDPTDECKYYCPLCMLYYECVYETKCCGHTICDECAAGLLDTAAMQGIGSVAEGSTNEASSSQEKEDDIIPEASFPLTPNCTSTKVLPVQCPFCRVDGMALKIIEAECGEHLRNYSDSPAMNTRTPGSTKSNNAQTPGGGLRAIRPSPLKVGDSFEKMMSKLVPFNQADGKKATTPPSRPSSREALSRPSSREAIMRPGSREGVRPSSRESVGSAARPPRPPRSQTPLQVLATTPSQQLLQVPILEQAPNSQARDVGAAISDAANEEENELAPSQADNKVEELPHIPIPGHPSIETETPQRITSHTVQAAGTPLGIEPIGHPAPSLVAAS